MIQGNSVKEVTGSFGISTATAMKIRNGNKVNATPSKKVAFIRLPPRQKRFSFANSAKANVNHPTKATV